MNVKDFSEVTCYTVKIYQKSQLLYHGSAYLIPKALLILEISDITPAQCIHIITVK